MRQWLLRANEKISAQRVNHKERSPLLRLIVFLVATTSLLAGLLLIFLPGPGVLLIALALALYSLEFHWLGRLSDRFLSKEKNR